MLRLVFIIVSVIVGCLIGGFIHFVHQINTPTTQAVPGITDGISVFTGGKDRISQGIELLQAGTARRLLISGVNEGTTAQEISDELGIQSPLFACCIDLGHSALNTVGNAEETAVWARKNQYQTIRIVTTTYHVPRSLIEIRRIAPELQVYPHPIQSEQVPTDAWWHHPDAALFLLREYAKYLFALARWRLSHTSSQ